MSISYHYLKKRIKQGWILYQQAILYSKNKDSLDLEGLIRQMSVSSIFRSDQRTLEIRRLLGLIETRKSKVILEIGSSKGGTLFLICQAASPDAVIISLDINYTLERRLAHSRFRKPGQKIICIEGNSQSLHTFHKVRKALRGKELDLLFIDGDHRFFGVMSDYVLYSPLVRAGGVIGLHDIQPDSQMRYGIKTLSYVGEVPIFWSALVQSGLKTDQIIEDPEQDGRGIGLVYKE